jgi:hypothetical protein
VSNDSSASGPSSATGDSDETATAISEDVGTAAAPSESETESVYAWSLDDGEEPGAEGRWRGRLLWAGLVALLCATVAAVVWFSMTFYAEDWAARKSAPPAHTSAAPQHESRKGARPLVKLRSQWRRCGR